MNALKPENVAVNLPLFKLLGLHRILDPNNSKTVFNLLSFNVYRLMIDVATSIKLAVLLVTLLNNFAKMQNDTIDDLQTIQMLFFYTMNFRSILMSFVCMFKATDIWNLFGVTRMNFLTAQHCRKHVRVLQECRKTSIKISNCFIIFQISVVIIWCVFPFTVTTDPLDADSRKENIGNLLFPVTARIYNEYYSLFYVIEFLIVMHVLYFFSMFIVYFISFSCVFIAQYDIIALAYKDVGNKCCKTQIDKGKSNLSVIMPSAFRNLRIKT